MGEQLGHARGRLAFDKCELDSIWDRDVETWTREAEIRAANVAWSRLSSDITDRCSFYELLYAKSGVRLGDVRSIEELARLPMIDKTAMRSSQEEAPPYGRHLGVDRSSIKRVFQTSGSSGRPSVIALTDSDLETWTRIGSRSYFATGVHPHNAILTTFGAGPYVAGHTHATLDRIGSTRVPVGPGDTEKVVNAINLGLVDTLLGTPSFVLHLASVFEDRGVKANPTSLRHVVVGGEPGGGIPAIRSRIESTLGVAVSEVSGIGDISPSLYGECPVQGGMHFCGQGLVWVELIDPRTEENVSIEPGARGEAVYTTLVRSAMPMVRFRSRDIVEVTDTSCPCGRTSFKIRIHGRSDDMFIVRGVNVYPAAVQSVVAEFQPRVTGRTRIILPEGSRVSVEPPVRIQVEVRTDPVDPFVLGTQIADAVKSKLNFRVEVEFLQQSAFGDPRYKTNPVATSD